MRKFRMRKISALQRPEGYFLTIFIDVRADIAKHTNIVPRK